MDTLTAKIFKTVEANKATWQQKKSIKAKTSRPHSNLKSRFQIMKEKLEALEWKPELPPSQKAFIPKGWRTATLRWIGFALKDSGTEQKIVEFIVRRAAKEICFPPITDNNIVYIIEGIIKSDIRPKQP